jgi:hypothetical protein
MADELSLLNLADDFVEATACPEASRWNLRGGTGLEVRATMGSAKVPGELFEMRLLWTAYPGEPPSLKFVDPGTGRIDVPTAWPAVRGFRPTSLDACVNWCAEGFALHPEWRNDPRYRWDSRGNVLLKVLRILQEELDEQCAGRFRP